MSIESEKKRLTDFLAEQTAAFEANKQRAKEHAEAAIAAADHAIATLKDHVAKEIAQLEQTREAAAKDMYENG
jgi:hypothetical protein